MEQKNKLNRYQFRKQSNNNRIYRFFTNLQIDKMFIDKQSREHLTIQTMRQILRHPKRNELLDNLELDWIYKYYSFPKLIINKEIIASIKNDEIKDHLGLTAKYLSQKGLSGDVTDELFYKKVIRNQYMDNKDKLNIACDILSIDEAPYKIVNEVVDLVQKVLSDRYYRQTIVKCINADIKVDTSLITDVICNKLYDKKIEYSGKLTLPKGYTLVNSWQDIKNREQFESSLLRAYWIQATSNKIFLIQMEGSQNNIFYISKYKNKGWFVIENILTTNEGSPSNKDISEIWRNIVLEESQQFFNDNFIENRIANYDYSQWEIPDLLEQL